MAAKKSAAPVAPGMEELFSAFTAFMQGQATPAPVAVEGGRSGTRKGKKSAPLQPLADEVARTRKPKPVAKSAKGVITCGEAWKLLGGDPTYTPSNPAAPARNTQLWALNQRGLLAVKA